MNTAIPDRYLLAADFEQRAVNIKFPPGVWNVAAALAGVTEATSPRELESMTGQTSDQILEALDRLLAKKLVQQNLMSWKEYTDAKMATGGIQITPPPAKVVSVATMSPSKPVAPVYAPAARSSQEGVALRLGSITHQQSTPVATSAWVSQKPDPVQVAASKPVTPTTLTSGEQINGRLMRPILAQIENLKGGGVEGQLLVYQVFLRVPYQLLHDEGIKALHFVDERTVIKNPALLAAIAKAAKEVTGVDLE